MGRSSSSLLRRSAIFFNLSTKSFSKHISDFELFFFFNEHVGCSDKMQLTILKSWTLTSSQLVFRVHRLLSDCFKLQLLLLSVTFMDLQDLTSINLLIMTSQSSLLEESDELDPLTLVPFIRTSIISLNSAFSFSAFSNS